MIISGSFVGWLIQQLSVNLSMEYSVVKLLPISASVLSYCNGLQNKRLRALPEIYIASHPLELAIQWLMINIIDAMRPIEKDFTCKPVCCFIQNMSPLTFLQVLDRISRIGSNELKISLDRISRIGSNELKISSDRNFRIGANELILRICLLSLQSNYQKESYERFKALRKLS